MFFKFLTITALALNLLFWLIAHASGHKISIKTDLLFCFSALALSALHSSLERIRLSIEN